MVYDALSLGKTVSTFRKIVVSSAVYELFKPEASPKHSNQEEFDLQQNRCKTLTSHTNKSLQLEVFQIINMSAST